MSEKTYYKVIDKITNEIVFYISADLPIKPKVLCEILGLKKYYAEIVTKEEYEKGT